MGLQRPTEMTPQRNAPHAGPRARCLVALCACALALAACGGAQSGQAGAGRAATATPPSPAVVTTAPGEGLIIGPDVDARWLGAMWEGALPRLAANPDATTGGCAGESFGTLAQSVAVIETGAGGPARGDQEQLRDELDLDAPMRTPAAEPAPAWDVRLYLLSDIVSAGLGVSAPRGDEVVVVRVVDEVSAAGCPLRSTQGLRAERLVRGGVMVVRGPASAALIDPGVALSTPGIEVISMSGWELVDGRWRTTAEPVLAAFAEPAAGSVAVACTSGGFDASVQDVLHAWEAAALGSPATVAQARLVMLGRVDPAEPADALVVAWASSLDPSGAAEHLAEADALVETCSHTPGARVAAAMIYEAAELYEDAAALLRQPIDDTVATRAVRHTLAATLAQRAGDDERAALELNEALDAFPGYRPALLQLGRLQRDTNRSYAVAAQTLERATGDERLDAVAYFELGSTLELVGRDTEAAAAFERSAALDDRYPQPTNALGCIAWTHALYDDARTLFENTLQRDAEFAPAMSNLGFLLENVDEDYAAAEALYRDAIRLDPSSASAHFNLGYLLEQRFGRLDAAAAAYETALRLDPGHSDASAALSNLRARPDASIDALMGSWTATLVGDGDAEVSVLATFLPSGRLTVVERAAGGDARTRRYAWALEQTEGPQLRLTLDEAGTVEGVTVEFLAPDRFVLFYPDEPAYTRVIFERRAGGDLASIARPDGA